MDIDGGNAKQLTRGGAAEGWVVYTRAISVEAPLVAAACATQRRMMCGAPFHTTERWSPARSRSQGTCQMAFCQSMVCARQSLDARFQLRHDALAPDDRAVLCWTRDVSPTSGVIERRRRTTRIPTLSPMKSSPLIVLAITTRHLSRTSVRCCLN